MFLEAAGGSRSGEPLGAVVGTLEPRKVRLVAPAGDGKRLGRWTLSNRLFRVGGLGEGRARGLAGREAGGFMLFVIFLKKNQCFRPFNGLG